MEKLKEILENLKQVELPFSGLEEWPEESKEMKGWENK